VVYVPDAVNNTFAGFFNNNVLIIPKYQRGFSWEKPQILEFWSDLVQLPEGKIHYCGSILTKEREPELRSNSHSHVQQREIIDGQQRCACVYIILLAMRDRLNEIDGEVALQLRETIDHDYLFFHPLEGQPDLRIKNETVDLHTFLWNLANGHPSVPQVAPEQRILNSYEIFCKLLEDYDVQEISDIFYKITTQMHSTEVYLDDQMDEPTVFESINNRGLSLSPMDQLKNYMILLADRCPEIDPDDMQFESHWFSGLERLMKKELHQRKDENNMLAYYWIMHKQGTIGAEQSKAFENFRVLEMKTIQQI